nr:hypothetical protein [Tanacetum cinerariifolium]
MVNLDAEDEDAVEEQTGENTRRTRDKEILLTESWVEDSTEPIDEDNLAKLFGPDPRPRPADKPRPTKKAESMDTSSARGSQSESLTRVLSQDYRPKCEAIEVAYEEKKKKELGFLECRDLEFLMIDLESFSPQKAAYI